MENCKILVANTPMDYDKIKIYGTKVKVESLDRVIILYIFIQFQVAEIEAAEKLKMKTKVEKICAYKPNVFINR